MQLGVELSFLWDTFVIETIIGGQNGSFSFFFFFFCYSITINLPFKVWNLYLWVGASFDFKKKQSSYGHALKMEKKYTCIEELLDLFLFLNNKNTKLPWVSKKTKASYKGVFVFFIWFCCKSQLELGVIECVGMCVLY